MHRHLPADPICFVHGFLGTPECWQPVRQRLRSNRSDRALWLPGHGPQPDPLPPPNTLTGSVFETVAQRLWQQVQARSCILVGYSLGARMALAMALLSPQRVAHLVLIGGNAGIANENDRRSRCQRDQLWAHILRDQGLNAFLAAWEDLPLFASQKKLPTRVLHAQRQSRSQHHPEALAHTIVAMSPGAMPVFSERLDHLQCPVDWMVGSEDKDYVARAKKMSLQHRTSRCVIVPGVGHNVVLEAPAAVASHIAAL